MARQWGTSFSRLRTITHLSRNPPNIVCTLSVISSRNGEWGDFIAAAQQVAGYIVISAEHSRTCRQASWGVRAPETGYKYVHASDDGGRSWQHVGLPGVMQWPQIFTCASGAPAIPFCSKHVAHSHLDAFLRGSAEFPRKCSRVRAPCYRPAIACTWKTYGKVGFREISIYVD